MQVVDDFMISNLESGIANLHGDLNENNQKIMRLEKAISVIVEEQSVAMENRRLIQKPEITSELWNGKHAEVSIEIRSKIEAAYIGIFETDIEALLTEIENKINQLKTSNHSISSSISSKRAILEKFRNK